MKVLYSGRRGLAVSLVYQQFAEFDTFISKRCKLFYPEETCSTYDMKVYKYESI